MTIPAEHHEHLESQMPDMIESVQRHLADNFQIYDFKLKGMSFAYGDLDDGEGHVHCDRHGCHPV